MNGLGEEMLNKGLKLPESPKTAKHESILERVAVRKKKKLTNGLVSSGVDPGDRDLGGPTGNGYLAGEDHCQSTVSIVR